MIARLRAALRRPSIKDFYSLSASNQVAAFASVGCTILLAREVRLDEFGSVVLAQSLAALAILVLDVRFDDGIQALYARVRDTLGREKAAGYFWRLASMDFVYAAASGGVVAVLLSIASFQIGDLPSASLMVPAALYAAVTAPTGSLMAGYAVTGSLPRFARTQLMLSMLLLVVCGAATLIAGSSGFLWSTFAMAVFKAAVMAREVGSLMGNRQRLTPEERPSGTRALLVKTSLGSTIGAGGEPGVLALAGLAGSEAFLGLLRVALTPGRFLAGVFSPIATSAFPRLALMSARGEVEQMDSYLRRVTRASALLGASALAAACAVLPWAIPLLYGSAFRTSVLAAILLVFAAGVRGAVAWSKVWPVAVGRPGLRAVIVAVDVVLLLSLMILATRAGTNAEQQLAVFAIGSCVAASVWCGLWVAIVRRHLGGVR